MPAISKYYLAKRKKRIAEEQEARKEQRARQKAEIGTLTDEQVLAGEQNKTSKYAAIRAAGRPANTPSPTFKKLKNMSVAQYLILTGKIRGETDEEIAKQLDCHVCSVARERKKLQSSDWMQDVVLKVLDLAELWVEALRVNLLQGNPIVTIAYGRGIGALADKHEVTYKVDRAEMQKKFAERMERALGEVAKKQIEDTLKIDMDKDVTDEDSNHLAPLDEGG